MIFWADFRTHLHLLCVSQQRSKFLHEFVVFGKSDWLFSVWCPVFICNQLQSGQVYDSKCFKICSDFKRCAVYSSLQYLKIWTEFSFTVLQPELTCERKKTERIVWPTHKYSGVPIAMLTFGLFASKRPVERPMRRASSWWRERRGETEREREVTEEESSNEDWADRMANAIVRLWAGLLLSFTNRGSSIGQRKKEVNKNFIWFLFLTVELNLNRPS